MQFKIEVNPRDYDGYNDMLAHLQDKCEREMGHRFDESDVRMGRVQPNAELFWFEAAVCDGTEPKRLPSTARTVKQYLEGKCTVDTDHLPISDAIEAIRLDRLGVFPDSPHHGKTVNVNIQSLGTFHVSTSSESDLKKKVTDIILSAINDAALI
jgi:hypothetical protein